MSPVAAGVVLLPGRRPRRGRRLSCPRGAPAAARGLEPLVEEVARDGLARRPRDHAPQQVVLGSANRVALVLILLLVLLKIYTKS